jgi:hypothetical protein
VLLVVGSEVQPAGVWALIASDIASDSTDIASNVMTEQYLSTSVQNNIDILSSFQRPRHPDIHM